MYRKEYAQKYRAARYEKGLCNNCSENRLENSIFCQKHLDADTEKRAIKLAKANSSGLCSHCFKAEALPNKKRCIKCQEENKQKAKQLRQAKLSEGLCCSSGCDNKCVENKKYCEYHLAKQTTDHAELRLRRQEQGLCKECFRPKLPAHYNCEMCYYKLVSSRNLGTTKRWQELKTLFEKNSICPYTGIQLVLGENTSLDHIIPVGRGGTNDLDNLQWVYFSGCGGFDVNRMKGAMFDQEFKEAIMKLYDHMVERIELC